MANMVTVLAALPEGRPFALDQQMLFSIIIQLFNACVLAGVMSYFLYKPVHTFMQERSERIKARLQQAEQGANEAEEMKNLYTAKLEEIEQERLEILEAARAMAAERTRQMLDDCKEDINNMRRNAEAELKREREKVNEDISHYILEVALGMARKFVTVSIDGAAQERIFTETVAELEKSSWIH